MAAVDIIEVEGRSQLKAFIEFPNKLYKDDPNYVAPLMSERLEFFDQKNNPFYRIATIKLYLAKRDGEIVGRLATCINYRHNDFHMEKVGFFGFFDTIDDYDVAHALLKWAMIRLKQAGMEKMRGPMNFSTNHEIGFLVEGFDDPPVVMMTYNYPYQPKLAEKFGFKKAMDVLAAELTDERGISERAMRVTEKMQQRARIKIRGIRMKEFDKEVQRIKDVYNQAWEHNWGFVPMDDEEFKYMAKQMRQIIEPELVLVAEHDDQPVAFLLALPDINQALIRLNGKLFPFGLAKLLWHTKVRNKIDRARIITLGVIPKFQRRGIDSMLYVECFKRGTAIGYHRAELSWMLETNDLILSAVKEMGAEIYKRYRIMELPL